jgi:hypothetical protein
MRTGDAPAPGKIRFLNTFSPIFIVWKNGNRGNTVEKRLWFKTKDDLPKRSLIFSQTCKEWAPEPEPRKARFEK